MKTTGIARKVDDLGRITIPKEIRSAMRIHEEDKMEFFIDGRMIGLMKQVADEISRYGKLIASAIHTQTGYPVVVCDTDKVVYAPGELGSRLVGQSITETLYQKILELRQKRHILALDAPLCPVVGHSDMAIAMVPVLNNTQDIFGAILLMGDASTDTVSRDALASVQTAAAIIGGILDE